MLKVLLYRVRLLEGVGAGCGGNLGVIWGGSGAALQKRPEKS